MAAKLLPVPNPRRKYKDAREDLRKIKRCKKLAEKHLYVVDRIAAQVHVGMTHVDIKDLRGDGYIGLMEAARKYSKDKGIFAHFCYFRVRGAMYDAHPSRALPRRYPMARFGRRH